MNGVLVSVALLSFLVSCGSPGSSHPGKNSGGETSLAATTNNTGAKTDKAVHDTILWVGVTARWIKSPDLVYDGSYDSSNGLFQQCSHPDFIKVARGQIDLETQSACDTSIGASIKLMDVIKSDSTIYASVPISIIPSASGPVTLRVADRDFNLRGNQQERLRTAVATHSKFQLEQVKLLR